MFSCCGENRITLQAFSHTLRPLIIKKRQTRKPPSPRRQGVPFSPECLTYGSQVDEQRPDRQVNHQSYRRYFNPSRPKEVLQSKRIQAGESYEASDSSPIEKRTFLFGPVPGHIGMSWGVINQESRLGPFAGRKRFAAQQPRSCWNVAHFAAPALQIRALSPAVALMLEGNTSCDGSSLNGSFEGCQVAGT